MDQIPIGYRGPIAIPSGAWVLMPLLHELETSALGDCNNASLHRLENRKTVQNMSPNIRRWWSLCFQLDNHPKSTASRWKTNRGANTQAGSKA